MGCRGAVSWEARVAAPRTGPYAGGVWIQPPILKAAAPAERGRVVVTSANVTEPAVLAERFRKLADQWKAETTFLSSSTAIANHPAYLAVIALGPPVVPLLLRDLEGEPFHWFEALEAITGEDPVRPEERGHIRAMAAAWLAWGRSHHLI